MPVPDYALPRPVYAQIADDLREQIRKGRYSPGDRLPSVREMSEAYGVVRETIQRVLRILTDEGLVQSQSTRGTFVLKAPGEPEPSPEYLKLVAEIEQLAERLRRLEARMDGLDGGHNGQR
jgi:DNA-binding GntR family transcriptional regulator